MYVNSSHLPTQTSIYYYEKALKIQLKIILLTGKRIPLLVLLIPPAFKVILKSFGSKPFRSKLRKKDMRDLVKFL